MKFFRKTVQKLKKKFNKTDKKKVEENRWRKKLNENRKTLTGLDKEARQNFLKNIKVINNG